MLTRGPETSADSDGLWQAWYGLQRELAGLSRNSRHLISDSPQHYLNEGDPDLIVAAVTDVIRCARDGARTGRGGRPGWNHGTVQMMACAATRRSLPE